MANVLSRLTRTLAVILGAALAAPGVASAADPWEVLTNASTIAAEPAVDANATPVMTCSIASGGVTGCSCRLGDGQVDCPLVTVLYLNGVVLLRGPNNAQRRVGVEAMNAAPRAAGSSVACWNGTTMQALAGGQEPQGVCVQTPSGGQRSLVQEAATRTLNEVRSFPEISIGGTALTDFIAVSQAGELGCSVSAGASQGGRCLIEPGTSVIARDGSKAATRVVVAVPTAAGNPVSQSDLNDSERVWCGTVADGSFTRLQEFRKSNLQFERDDAHGCWVERNGGWSSVQASAAVVLTPPERVPGDTGDTGGRTRETRSACGDSGLRLRECRSADVCIEIDEGRVCELKAPQNHIISPNREVAVVLRYRRGQTYSIELQGTPGLYDAPLRRPTQQEIEALEQQAEGGDEAVAFDTVRVVFGPRQPGAAPLVITDTTNQVTHTVELIVETTYSGAIRIGFGMVFGGAVDRRYTAQAYPGSDQSEIVANGGGDLDIELVVGIAPFLETFMGGRGYHSGRNLTTFPFGLAPYVGLGLIGSRVGGAEFLTSFYFGLEWEPIQNFSVAATIVARRVHRLLPGLSVGDAVAPGAVLSREGYELGLGIVINVSPEFLQFTGAIAGGG